MIRKAHTGPTKPDRGENFPFSMMQSDLDGKQGCIWRTRSLDEGNPANHVSSDLHLAPENGENVPALHSSFDAAQLLETDRASDQLFEGHEKLCFDSTADDGENPVYCDLVGKKHLRPRTSLEALENHSAGAVRKQARMAIGASRSSGISGRPGLRHMASTSSPALRRRAALHQRQSAVSRTSGLDQCSAQLSLGQISTQCQTAIASDATKSPKHLTPTLSMNDSFPSTSTKKSLSKLYHTGTTGTATLLETTFETDSIEASSPPTTRFRFTSFPASLPRVTSPRNRRCPDSVCKRMSFNETSDIDILNRSRDDEGTQNTSISSLSADGGHPFPKNAVREARQFELQTDNSKVSERFGASGAHLGPCNTQMFQYAELLGRNDDENLESPMSGKVSRTRLDFNMFPSPPITLSHSPTSNAGGIDDTALALSTPFERSVKWMHSSHPSNKHMGTTSFSDEVGTALTPARHFLKEDPETPPEMQLHFPPATECSPIPNGDGIDHAVRDATAVSSTYKVELSREDDMFGHTESAFDVKQKEEDSTASESTSARLRRLRPMPDMSAFESTAASSRGDCSVDNCATLDSEGMQPTQRLLCPPTPVRTPAWASEGKPKSYLGSRQNSLITTKVLLACPSQVLEGRTSLENSLLDDDSKASASIPQANAAESVYVAVPQYAQNSNFDTVETETGNKEFCNAGPGAQTVRMSLAHPRRAMHPASLSEEAGSVISFAEDFEILCSLGSGAFADVYKVRSNRDNCLYAVKRNRRQFRGMRDRNIALAEVQYMQRLQSTCIDSATTSNKNSYSLYLLCFYRAWQENGYLFCQIELCCRDTCRELLDSLRVFWSSSKKKYPSLMRNLPASTATKAQSERVVSGRCLPNMTIWKICHDVSAGLCHIHSHGLVHHDIKPSNIFLVPHPRFGAMCKIGDFGMAGNVGSSSDGQEGDTRYMPPELLSSISRHRSADIFSLGLMLYEIATEHHVEMPSEGPLWHELRSNASPHLPLWRGLELRQLVEDMTNPREQKRPTADKILQCNEVISAGRGCDEFLRDYLVDIEEYDKSEERKLAMHRNEDQTPRNSSNRSKAARSPSLSMLLPTAPNLLSPVAHAFR